MSIDLGIRAAVRAAVDRESDYWMAGLLGRKDAIVRGTPYGALLFARERNCDFHDACHMLWWAKSPHSAPRRFLRKVTP